MRFLIFLLILLIWPVASHAEASLTASKVLSADTLLLSDGNTLKLSGITCADLGHQNACAASRDYLQNLVGNHALLLNNPTIDRYGRISANLYALDDKGSKIDIQQALLEKGLVFVYPPVGDEPNLAAALKTEFSARQAKRGLWAYSAYADTPADEAEKLYGHFAFVSGKVLKAERIKNMVYLNFGDNWKNDFTIAIAAHDLHNFRAANIDPLSYQGKTIRVRGWVKRMFGPMITVTDPHQLEIISAP